MVVWWYWKGRSPGGCQAAKPHINTNFKLGHKLKVHHIYLIVTVCSAAVACTRVHQAHVFISVIWDPVANLLQLGNIYNTCWKLVSKQKRQCVYPHENRPHQPHRSSSPQQSQHATDVTHLDSVLKCSWAGRSGDNELLLLAQLPGWQRWPIVWHFLSSK